MCTKKFVSLCNLVPPHRAIKSKKLQAQIARYCSELTQEHEESFFWIKDPETGILHLVTWEERIEGMKIDTINRIIHILKGYVSGLNTR
jgi:hypothetical protein